MKTRETTKVIIIVTERKTVFGLQANKLVSQDNYAKSTVDTIQKPGWIYS